MLATIQFPDRSISVDLSKPIDISIPLLPDGDQPNAYNAPPFEAEPVRAGDFVGSVSEGGPVNFMDIKLNPHGNGTHTECVGHISDGGQTISQCVRQFFFMAQLVSVSPEEKDGDQLVQSIDIMDGIEALVIRTLPNDDSKLSRNYSGTNPPYFDPALVHEMVAKGIEHLLTDLPSVDPENDRGKLSAHKAFWTYPEAARENATITEMIYVPDIVADGEYLLNIQLPSFGLDAAPSKPILYSII